MRRCSQCQAPNPDVETSCRACGAALPALRASWRSGWSGLRGPGLKRALWALVPAFLFQISAGSLLSVGLVRQEWHFLVFHLVFGLLLGLSLAWLWSVSGPLAALGWAGAGLAGGLLAEVLEFWFSYHHWMGLLSLGVWSALGLPQHPSLVYELLQILRLAGPLICLGYWRARSEPGAGAWARFSGGGLLALALGGQVRGAWVAWNALATALGWGESFLCALSLLALVWALGPGDLTLAGQIP